MRKTLTALSLILLSAGSAQAVDKAGVSAGVRGNVVRSATQSSEAVGANLKSGDAIYMGDGIESKPDAGMQIMLMDQTTFTIGPDSQIVIDEFVYDPNAGAGKVGASILKGGFRFVSGKIAAAKSDNMTVKTPTATIGVRGTGVFGFVGPLRTIIALAGPGPRNNTGDKVAGIVVFTAAGDAVLRRAGFAVSIVPGLPPVVIRVTPELMQQIENALTPSGGSGGGSGSRSQSASQGSSTAAPSSSTSSSSSTSTTSTSSTSTSTTSTSTSTTSNSGSTGGGLAGVSNIGTAGGSDLGNTLGNLSGLSTVGDLVGASSDQLSNVSDQQNGSSAEDYGDFTTLTQLASISAGTGTYAQTNVPLFDTMAGMGSYDFNLTVNFASATFTGGFTNINSANLGISGGSLPLITSPFQPPIAFVQEVGMCGSGVTCTGTVFLTNNGSDIARNAEHFLQLDNGSVQAVGSGVAVGTGF